MQNKLGMKLKHLFLLNWSDDSKNPDFTIVIFQ